MTKSGAENISQGMPKKVVVSIPKCENIIMNKVVTR